MADYPYILVTGKLKKFLTQIQTAAVPSKLTLEYLSKSSFNSSNDRKIINVLQFISFIDSENKPTSLWSAYRDKEKAPVILGNAIKNAYSSLISIYSDACTNPSDSIRNFFATDSKGGDEVINANVSTFRSLCSLASFQQEQSQPTLEPKQETQQQQNISEQPKIDKQLPLQSITINIQITMPETKVSSVYDSFFESMRKHLFEPGK
jgi:hypothetical protein